MWSAPSFKIDVFTKRYIVCRSPRKSLSKLHFVWAFINKVCFLGKHVSFLSLQRKKINKEEDLLGCEVRSAFPQIQEIIEAKEPFDKLWRALVTFHDKQEMWLAGPILKLNAEEIEEEVFLKYILAHVLLLPVTTCLLWSSSVLSVSRYALWKLSPGKKLICACSRWINHWKLLSFSCAFPRPFENWREIKAKLMKKWINRDTIVFGKHFLPFLLRGFLRLIALGPSLSRQPGKTWTSYVWCSSNASLFHFFNARGIALFGVFEGVDNEI